MERVMISANSASAQVEERVQQVQIGGTCILSRLGAALLTLGTYSGLSAHKKRSSDVHPTGTKFPRFARILFGLFLLSAYALGSSQAYAQSCTAIPQRITNGALANSFTGWTLSPTSGAWTTNSLGSPSAQHWANQGTATVTVPTSFDTISQNITRVSGGSVVQLDMAWNNAQRNSGSTTPWDGNRARLVVQYDGVIYASLYTSSYQGLSTSSAPGPRGDVQLVAENGATILSGTAPNPSNVTGTAVFNWATVRIQLPDDISNPNGTFTIGVQRVGNGMPAGETDDVYVRNVSLQSRSVCLDKVSNGGVGTFGFTTTGLDNNLVTAGDQSTFSITTVTAGTAVGRDTDTGTTGAQPALTMSSAPVTIQETSSSNAALELNSVSCTNGVTATINGQTVTLGTIPGGTQISCRITNAPIPQYGITLMKRWSNPLRNNAVNLTISGGTGATGGTSQAGTATDTNATATGRQGSTITLQENFTTGNAASYTTNFACTRDSDGSNVATGGSGTSRTMTMPSGAVTCIFTNSIPFPPPLLPPVWTGAKTCPSANPMTNALGTLNAGWTHNTPANTINQDEFGADFPSSNQIVAGPGVSLIPFNTIGVTRMVDTTSAAQAFSAGDYLDYKVTTGANPGDRALQALAWGIHNSGSYSDYYNFQFSVLVSTSSTFATAQTALQDVTTTFATSGGYQYYYLMINPSSRVLLQPNTTYYFRVLLYNATGTGGKSIAGWDDFRIYTANCETQQVQLAKNWTGGTAGHQASATTIGAINNNPTFTSTAPTATTGSYVNLYKGETITLPAETYGGGATAALYNTTVSCTGGTPLASGAPGRSITIQASNTPTTCTYTNLFVGPLTVTKTSAPVWDPANLTTNPKMIPGSYVDYTIDVKSPATTADSNSVIVTDALPSQINLCVAAVGQCTLPVRWTVGTSGLTYTYTSLAGTTDDVSFSTDGTNWNYVPVAGADGTDPAIRHVRVNPKGAMNPNSQFSILLRTLIK
ncbi:prealbumin-like fold domain-containing protein [Pseudonocardia sp. TMWB2A]|uniref:prealbumin-like fold domain-containing protein n=1 Tax=Pseudonocardia sp. TMWB2A TaxID=687430 RepID=UPI00307DF8AD